MAVRFSLGGPTIESRPKKTRQGNGRGTKFSTRNSKRFKKKYRGQGKC